jgi:mono/diheme cytochrome c family protein
MTALIFVLVFIFLGIGVLFVAMSGGPGGAAARLQSQSRGTRRLAAFNFFLALILLGVAVPVAVIAIVKDRNSLPEANVSNLTPAQQRGLILFGERCSACHTLRAANAVAQVGPNLDDLQPPKALVLDAIAKGRARGNGNMPAQIYQGQDAQDVADFVARVDGSENRSG